MLLRGIEALAAARAGGSAIPAFVAYNLEGAQAIVAAAEQTGQPVLLLAGASAFRHTGRGPLATLALTLARGSSAAIGVHLDHSTSLEEVAACLELGYTSVMVDGSALPFSDNIELTRRAVEHAHATGAWVEAELGAIAGDEDRSTNARAGGLTDPAEAERFVEATGVDALAIAIGNVHGLTDVEPAIDLELLDEIAARVPVPLVLHGASGLSPHVLRGCVARGVAKFNVNTELRRAYLEALASALPAARDGADLAAAMAAARDAVTACAVGFVELLGAPTAGTSGEAST